MGQLGVYHVHVMKTGGTSLAGMLPFAPYPTPELLRTRPHEKFAPEILLAMAPEERDQFFFVSTHMAAWVAEDLFPHYLSVTVLRDPVERTISHLKQIAELPGTPVDLEEIYEDPMWHSRLVNYQVQVFAASRAEHLAQEPDRRAYDPSRHPDPERTRVRAEVRAAFATAIGIPKLIDERSYAEAAARLDRVDEVGVTERLGELVDRLGARLGLELGPLRRQRVSKLGPAVSAALRESIEDENEWDRTLYERALARQAG
jgi:tetrahydromethanopterin S-methyltransferase subunit G